MNFWALPPDQLTWRIRHFTQQLKAVPGMDFENRGSLWFFYFQEVNIIGNIIKTKVSLPSSLLSFLLSFLLPFLSLPLTFPPFFLSFLISSFSFYIMDSLLEHQTKSNLEFFIFLYYVPKFPGWCDFAVIEASLFCLSSFSDGST